MVISHVLEHCRDPIAALANARALLSDRGVLMVETPNSAALGCKVRGAGWYWLDVPRHLNFFTEDSLRTLCAHVGLLPQRAEYSGFSRQFSVGWIEAETRIRLASTGGRKRRWPTSGGTLPSGGASAAVGTGAGAAQVQLGAADLHEAADLACRSVAGIRAFRQLVADAAHW